MREIKVNKKYKSLNDGVIKKEIANFLKVNPFAGDKKVVKGVRSVLHKTYASFQTRGHGKILGLLDDLKKDSLDFKLIDKLLSISLSTKERLKDYDIIYSKIFSITGFPSMIVDLGAGLNGFSVLYMGLDSLKYYCYDINEEDALLLNKFFKIIKINGFASVLDIRDFSKIDKLPRSDVVFLFKVLDLIDVKGHKDSEELIERLFNHTKFVVVSFATRTLTRRIMARPYRKWFELVCSRREWKFEKFNTDNEMFYVVKKY